MRIYTPSPSMNHIHEVFIQIWFNLDVLYGGGGYSCLLRQ